MRIIGILIAIYLSGCSALGPDPKRILIQEYNQGSLYLKYFHPNRPVWDKISDIGSCYIENDLSFIDIDTVKKELKLKLSETLQLQYGLNVKLQKLKKFYKIDYIDQKEEEKIFYELTDKVSSGILFLIHLVIKELA